MAKTRTTIQRSTGAVSPPQTRGEVYSRALDEMRTSSISAAAARYLSGKPHKLKVRPEPKKQ